MQTGTRVRAKTHDIAGIRRYFRLKKNDMKQDVKFAEWIMAQTAPKSVKVLDTKIAPAPLGLWLEYRETDSGNPEASIDARYSASSIQTTRQTVKPVARWHCNPLWRDCAAREKKGLLRSAAIVAVFAGGTPKFRFPGFPKLHPDCPPITKIES